MTNPNLSSTPERGLATPEQARELFGEVGMLTTLQGKNYGDRNTFASQVEVVPSEIASHLPEPQSTSMSYDDSVYIQQFFDGQTGLPRQNGIVAMVTFKRRERVDPQLLYIANANYNITTMDGEIFNVERHVTHKEGGRHKVEEMRRRRAQMAIDPSAFALEQLARVRSFQSRIAANRPLERALGMFDVTQAEAQRLLDYLHEVNAVADIEKT